MSLIRRYLNWSVLILLLLVFNSMIMSSQTKVIAHRGFSGKAPENTMIAFKKAIKIHADFIELDVHITKDDSLVVIHDATVNRTSSGAFEGDVSLLTFAELRDINVGCSDLFGDKYKNAKIPTLREVLKLAKGKIKVCIEIKVLGIEEKVLKTVNDLGMRDDMIIFSFYYPVLAKIRQLDDKISTLYLVDPADSLTIDYAKVINTTAIGVGYGTNISTQFLSLAHSYGIEVWKWTVNEETEMTRLIDVGIDGLITNYPDKANRIKRN